MSTMMPERRLSRPEQISLLVEENVYGPTSRAVLDDENEAWRQWQEGGFLFDAIFRSNCGLDRDLFCSVYVDPETAGIRIEQYSARLAEYAVNPGSLIEQSVDSPLKCAWEGLNDMCQKERGFLDEHDASVLIGGSNYYGDRVKGDTDLVVSIDKEDPAGLECVKRRIEKSLQERFPDAIADVWGVSLSLVERRAEEVISGVSYVQYKNSPWEDAEHATFWITGFPLSLPTRDLANPNVRINQARERVVRIAERCPAFAAVWVTQLDGVVKRREEKRLLPAGFFDCPIGGRMESLSIQDRYSRLFRGQDEVMQELGESLGNADMQSAFTAFLEKHLDLRNRVAVS